MVTNEHVVEDYEQVEVIVPLCDPHGRPIAELASYRRKAHGIVADPFLGRVGRARRFPTADLRRSDSPTGTHPAT